ncbi:hypothetical protein V6N13_136373 [Hibiscus sabdariffa]
MESTGEDTRSKTLPTAYIENRICSKPLGEKREEKKKKVTDSIKGMLGIYWAVDRLMRFLELMEVNTGRQMKWTRVVSSVSGLSAGAYWELG